MAVPAMLVHAGLDKADHWQVYLPAVLPSLILMFGVLFPLERRGHLRAAFLAAIAVLLWVQLALWWLAHPMTESSLWVMAGVIVLFFTSFNMLEAAQPSLVSRWVPAHARGAALGVYNTLQSLGFFVGGTLGGWLVHAHGANGLFAVCAAVVLVWLAIEWPMTAPSSQHT